LRVADVRADERAKKTVGSSLATKELIPATPQVQPNLLA
jgi:hypothetical protein